MRLIRLSVDGMSRARLGTDGGATCNRPMRSTLHPETLAQAPELATLKSLEMLLLITTRALVAAHPTLIDDGCAPWRRAPRSVRKARNLLRRVGPLRRALESYRTAVLDALAPADIDDSDIPF